MEPEPAVPRLDLSVVVPVYRSGAWIAALTDRVAAVLATLGHAWEIILVNDASPDTDTRPALDALSARLPRVRVVHLDANVGQFEATRRGLALARGALVVTMDDDFQHPPDEIPALVSAIASRPAVDAVVGAYRVKRHSWLRNAGSRLHSAVVRRLLGQPFRGPATTSFRVLRWDLAQALARSHGPLGPALRRLAQRLESVPVAHDARTAGRSGYGAFRLVREALRGVAASLPAQTPAAGAVRAPSATPAARSIRRAPRR